MGISFIAYLIIDPVKISEIPPLEEMHSSKRMLVLQMGDQV